MGDADKGWMMIGVGELMLLLVPAHLSSPGQKALKR